MFYSTSSKSYNSGNRRAKQFVYLALATLTIPGKLLRSRQASSGHRDIADITGDTLWSNGNPVYRPSKYKTIVII